MIEYLSGILVTKKPDISIIDVNGIGYKVNITNNSYELLPDVKNRVHLLIFFHVYENGQELYGFVDEDERYLFLKLISISGIGPKTAMNMLSVIPPNEFKNRLASGEVKMLTSLPGIGPKTAKRIILELGDDISNINVSNLSSNNQIDNDAFLALQSLGFSAQSINQAIGKIISKDKDLSTQEIIKKALELLK